MRIRRLLLVACLGWICSILAVADEPNFTGHFVHEHAEGLKGSVVGEFTLVLGPTESTPIGPARWSRLQATKANGQQFQAWLLSVGSVPESRSLATTMVTRYVVQEGDRPPVECVDRFTRAAVLPSVVSWSDLWPRPAARAGGGAETRASYLGHVYRRVAEVVPLPEFAKPGATRIVELLPDILVGVPSMTRQKDERRRYDGSEYEMIPLTREDYQEMVAAGLNCLRVDAASLPWIDGLGAFYWGVSPTDLPFPECLYRSQYLGPTLFLDEPAVGTRDAVLRPRLAKDPDFRRRISPELALEAFRRQFDDALSNGAPTVLSKIVAGRGDVDPGVMTLRQANLYTWETMVSTAAYQLSRDPAVPDAMVFEPPGRIGTRRTLPEFDMTYGCQIPTDVPANFTSIIYGFLRGAARLSHKSWGTSIYGAVDRDDAAWFLTHAYDLGATRFFFWDNAGLACVPYGECLALARGLRAHAEAHPARDLARLREAAEVVILIPPGYDLGHVQMGKGNLWGVGELNLERLNSVGVKHRRVMANLFTEIERCLRLGVAFDVLWDLPDAQPRGYRETVRIRLAGDVEVEEGGRQVVVPEGRAPLRPAGDPPGLHIELSTRTGPAPLIVNAKATVTETAAPVWYTFGGDAHGVHRNAVVAWEIFGPNDEDHRFVTAPGNVPHVESRDRVHEVSTRLYFERAGKYRVRAATVDLAGRSTVVWSDVVAE